jgi:hypothetical protein
MEIGPVSAVRLVPAIRTRESLLGLTDVYEVDRTYLTGDETYTPRGAKAASGYEEDEDTYNAEKDDELEDEPKVPIKVRAVANGSINYTV